MSTDPQNVGQFISWLNAKIQSLESHANENSLTDSGYREVWKDAHGWASDHLSPTEVELLEPEPTVYVGGAGRLTVIGRLKRLRDRLTTAAEVKALAANAEPLSTLDLPGIVEAVKTLFRTIETPSVNVPTIRAAVYHTAKALKLTTLSPNHSPTEITGSPFDRRQKLALVRLRDLLVDILYFRSAVAVDSGQSLKDLEALQTTLADLDAEPKAVTTAPPAGANAAEADGAKNGKQKRRGAPVATDEKADKRLCADWKAAKRQGMTRAAFAREKDILVNDIIAAQNREKYRRQRDAE